LKTREAAAELKRQQGTQHLAKAGQRDRLTTLKAPVGRTVQQLATHTEGGVITEAQPMMVIVPDGAQVTPEVTLDNKDISFVSPTQEAAIKLETFPYTRYGTVDATVKTVTADAVNDEKRGAIFPRDAEPQRHKHRGGCQVDPAIPRDEPYGADRDGQATNYCVLLIPIQKTTNESSHER